MTTDINGTVVTTEVIDPVTSTIVDDEESFNVAIGEAVDNGHVNCCAAGAGSIADLKF